MTWVATAIVGGAVVATIGSSIAAHNASNASTQAAQIQSQAAQQASQLQYQMYGNTRNDLLPFQNVGRSAIPYMNGLVPGGFGTSNPAGPLNGAGTTGPQISGYDENGSPVYSNTETGTDGTPQQFSGATGALSGGGTGGGAGSVPGGNGVTAGGTANPFLSAQMSNIPQLGPAAQNSLASFTPGSGGNPLQSSLYSYVNGASVTANPLLGSVNNAIVGGSGSPNSQLNNLNSFIPASPNGANLAPSMNNSNASQTAYNSLLGIADPNAQKNLDSINSGFKSAHDSWMAQNPDKTEDDWAKSDQVKGYNSQLVDFYKSNPSMLNSGIAQAKGQTDDKTYGGAATDRLKQLQTISDSNAGKSPQQLALEQTPGYQFALDQGLKSTQNGFAAQGLGNSGAAMKGAASFATGLASQTYNSQLQNYLQNYNASLSGVNTNLNNYNSQFNNANSLYNGTTNNALNAFNNQSNLAYNSYGQGFTNAFNMTGQQFNNANTGYQSQVNNAYNMMSLGANAAAETGTQGIQTANNSGGYLTSGANASAAGVVGSTNAMNNGILAGANNIGNTAMMYGMNPSMFKGSGSGVGNGLAGMNWSTPIGPGPWNLT